MKTIQIALASTLLALGLYGCGGLNGTTTSEEFDPTSASSTTELTTNDDAMANAMASGINALGEASQLSSAGISTETVAALEIEEETSVSSEKGKRKRRFHCDRHDPDLFITYQCSDTDHTATLIKDFGEGCDQRGGSFLTGSEYIGWTNMGSPACGTRRPDFWVAVQGTPPDAALRIVSTDPDSPTQPVAAIVKNFPNGGKVNTVGHVETSYSGYQKVNESQSINGNLNIPRTNRIRYKKDGTTKIFDHTISTPASLNFTLQVDKDRAPIRTVHSGELSVSHNLAQFTVHKTFAELQFDYNQCECAPVSGTVNVSVTDNVSSKTLGSGSITFTATETGECGTANVTYEGRLIRLPALEHCR